MCLAVAQQQAMCVEKDRSAPILCTIAAYPITVQTNSQRRITQWQNAHSEMVRLVDSWHIYIIVKYHKTKTKKSFGIHIPMCIITIGMIVTVMHQG